MFILTQAHENVLYLMYMNKEVIYLEPEDDITDILSKLQRAEQKVVALVPPKKATMLRSAVNMKLVAKAAKEYKKVAVVVTADPAISKMAMMAQIPVAKTLQSRPVVPTKESLEAAQADEQVIDEDLADVTDKEELDSLKNKAKTPAEGSESASKKDSDKRANVIDLSEESLENGSKKASEKGKKGADGKKVPDIAKYRKWIIAGVAAALVLIVFGVWAFVFAPAVQITVAMSTTSNNFSEEVRFTSDPGTENVAEGILYARKETYEPEYTEDFEATGREDRGEKATGKVSLRMVFTPTIGSSAKIGLASGAKLTATNADGKAVVYTLNEDYSTSFDGTAEGISAIESAGWTCPRTIVSGSSQCSLSVSAAGVTALAAGEDYNIGAGRTWNPIADDDENITISNSTAFAGGSSREVTTVTQANLDAAKERILASHASEGKSLLLDQVKSDDVIVIESSFKSEAGDVKSSPAVNAEVDENAKPEITVKAIYSVYALDRAKVEEFIKAKMTVADDQRIYSVGDPYVERFASIDEAARLKTVVKTGPTVNEEAILEKAKGRKIGEVQSLLRSINGVSSVEITPSYFWVNSVPNDANKVTIELTVEDK